MINQITIDVKKCRLRAREPSDNFSYDTVINSILISILIFLTNIWRISYFIKFKDKRIHNGNHLVVHFEQTMNDDA